MKQIRIPYSLKKIDRLSYLLGITKHNLDGTCEHPALLIHKVGLVNNTHIVFNISQKEQNNG